MDITKMLSDILTEKKTQPRTKFKLSPSILILQLSSLCERFV